MRALIVCTPADEVAPRPMMMSATLPRLADPPLAPPIRVISGLPLIVWLPKVASIWAKLLLPTVPPVRLIAPPPTNAMVWEVAPFPSLEMLTAFAEPVPEPP